MEVSSAVVVLTVGVDQWMIVLRDTDDTVYGSAIPPLPCLDTVHACSLHRVFAHEILAFLPPHCLTLRLFAAARNAAQCVPVVVLCFPSP